MEDSHNSTKTPLGSSTTFTGGWVNVIGFNSITIFGTTDQTGTFYADFSTDESTTAKTITLATATATLGYHVLIPFCKFFRIRLINDSVAQTSLNIQVILSIYDRSAMAAAIVNGGSSGDNVTITNNSIVDINRGSFSGQSTIRVVGVNPSIVTNTSEKICLNGTMNWLTSATTFEVVSTNTNDTAAGSGVQSVKIYGLDENWALANEIIATAGTSDSTATTTTFIRVFHAECINNGTYGGTNLGNITIKTSADSVHMVIGIGDGITKFGGYTIPSDSTGYITKIAGNVDKTSNVDIKIFIRKNANDVSTPFQSAFNIYEISEVSGFFSETLGAYISLQPYTDIWFEAVNGLIKDTSAILKLDIVSIVN